MKFYLMGVGGPPARICRLVEYNGRHVLLLYRSAEDSIEAFLTRNVHQNLDIPQDTLEAVYYTAVAYVEMTGSVEGFPLQDLPVRPV